MKRLLIVVVVMLVAYLAQQYLWKNGRPVPKDLLAGVDAPRALREHSQEFQQPQLIKVTEGVHVAIGFAVANSILLEAPNGLIVIDTTESADAAGQILIEFRKISNKPIKAVIYTHFHMDHISGGAVFIEDPDNPPDIWAHHTTMEQVERVSKAGVISYLRAM